MSKTVLLPDEIYSKIQNYPVFSNAWFAIKMSLAKKIELFFDHYNEVIWNGTFPFPKHICDRIEKEWINN
jgi:hypothetical protein